MRVLEQLGAQSVPKLPKGFKFNRMQVRKSSFAYTDQEGKIRSQVHFKPSKNDGLSYHINVTCLSK